MDMRFELPMRQFRLKSPIVIGPFGCFGARATAVTQCLLLSEFGCEEKFDRIIGGPKKRKILV